MYQMIDISVVIPLYRCSQTIEELCNRLQKVFLSLGKSYEIILINDGSPENDWQVTCSLIDGNSNIKGINLSRNFGQHPAIFCGLENVKGEWVVVMDGDLQDVPEEIEKLYNKVVEGYDYVLAARKVRTDKLAKKLNSYLFYKTLNFFTGSKLSHSVGNYGIFNKIVIESVLEIGDLIKFFPTAINWVGYNFCILPVRHSKRLQGKSSYNFYSLLSLAFNNIISFSNKPLKIFVKFGFFLVGVSLFMIFYNLYLKINGQITVDGYSSIVISIWFLFGCMISIIGVVGVYLGKVFDQVKNRPIFIIHEKINIE